ncbi:hypothetical protein SAMN06295885_3615 [Rathayibacter oskolensis]|uniref:GyrI-like small molecule binding domain-containing protein n=1 Tax=Rathayibacter oskolensis TaxID=1891671 RepID=A0A1X7PJB7_9MICO|nr:GyrI-like domain-containing protein [Rathayibacter oskolensis]SMH50765.1 hypothetical protein SAMN06295885_3615 [Rathayibacter oskolensis]
MVKLDLRAQISTYRARRGRFDVVEVAPAWFLAIDGTGDPNTSAAYADALATIYPVAYALTSLSRNELGRDYGVMPLEALWWSDDMTAFTSARDKAQWSWTLLLLTPDWMTDHVETAIETVRRKGRAPAPDAVRLQMLDEGLAAQTLHIGPYDDEGPVLEALHREFLPAHGLRMSGRHHEIYLGDPRRAAPEKLRTILRQPVERVDS